MEISNWTTRELCKLLGLAAPSAPGTPSDVDDLTRTVLALPVSDAVAQLSALLGEDSAALNFISEFALRRNTKCFSSSISSAQQQKLPPNTFGASQNSNSTSSPASSPALSSATKFKDPNRVYRKKDNNESYLISSKLPSKQLPAVSAQSVAAEPAKKAKPVGKKNYVPTTIDSLIAKERVGNLVGLNGRLICECLASKHGLLCNCLSCGKIICNLEGPGPCPSCGSLVESALQQVAMIQSNQNQVVPRQTSSSKFHHSQQHSLKTKAPAPGQNSSSRYVAKAGGRASIAVTNPGGQRDSEAVFPTLTSEKDLAALRKAEEQMARLLEYQKNSTARTRVHDTASDFDFQSDSQNKWLTGEERAIALKKYKEEARLEEERKKRRVITIDLQNKTVVHEVSKPTGSHSYRESYEDSKKKSQETAESRNQETEKSLMSPADGSTRLFHNPTLQISPKYIPPPVPKKEITKLPPKDKEPVQQPFKKNQQETERPKTMKALKILSIATTTEHGLDIAEAKKIIAKEEADARISLKVSKQRVQDENDFLENNWSVGDSIGSSVGDEPICG